MPKPSIFGLLVLAGCAVEAGRAGDPPAEPVDPAAGPSAPPPGASAAAPARDPVLLSWSFEPASADCNGWPALGGVGIRAAPPRTGAYSCKVCSNGSAPGVELVRDLGAAAPGRYVLTAWVRQRPATPAPSAALARIEADASSGPVRAASPSAPLREGWDRLEATLDLKSAAPRLRVAIGAPEAEAERCLFVDDVTLVRER